MAKRLDSSMPLGTEIGLGPGDYVLDGDPASHATERGTAAPYFRPTSIVAKRSPISATAELLSAFSLLCSPIVFYHTRQMTQLSNVTSICGQLPSLQVSSQLLTGN